jgi:hypothetical protein
MRALPSDLPLGAPVDLRYGEPLVRALPGDRGGHDGATFLAVRNVVAPVEYSAETRSTKPPIVFYFEFNREGMVLRQSSFRARRRLRQDLGLSESAPRAEIAAIPTCRSGSS